MSAGGWVELRTLSPGQSFTDSLGRRGQLLTLYPGSAEVRVEHETDRTFTPATGPNAGKPVRIRKSTEIQGWSLATRVRRA